MKNRRITTAYIAAFTQGLHQAERSAGTVEKYRRDVQSFIAWLGARDVSHEAAAGWKRHLQDQGYSPATINSMLVALNRFFDCMGWQDCRVNTLKLQRRLFRDAGRELSRAEYERLVETAANLSRPRLALLMEAICGTGVRVSEVRYLTVEAVQAGRADISLKGKIRTILIPNKLCRKLLKYARKQKITSGEIFLTRSGKGMSRRQIWAEMKSLCERAGVEPSKVFPHNLRHVFAAAFYKSCKDIVRLADVLGHSSVETTRIYLLTTGVEHAQMLERLGLVL